MAMKEIELSKKQGEAWALLTDKETGEIGYGGGAGGGKSFLGVAWLWVMANNYPGTRWFMGRRELTNLKRSTLNSYFKFLETYNVPKKNRGKLNQKDNVITFPNMSEILLLDCSYQPSDPLYTRFGSLELTGGFIDESNEISEQCVAILNSRVGRHRNDQYNITPKILETFNPDKGHVYRRYFVPWKKGELPPHRKFLQSLVGDNPKIEAGYKGQLERLDEVSKQRLLYGNFEYDNTFGKLFRYDEIVDLFSCNVEKDDTFYISADIARFGADKTVISVRKGYEVIKFYTLIEQPTDIVADKILELEQEFNVRRNHIVIDSDGVGGGVADRIRGCINFVNNATPHKSNADKNNTYVQHNYGNLKAQCYFKLKEMLERRLLRVHADGQVKDDLSNELDNLIVKNTERDGKTYMESKEEMKKRLNRSPDYADSCFVAGTKVLTNKGYKNIEDIDIGEYVVTPFGTRRVIDTSKTSSSNLYMLNNILVGTGNHKIYANKSLITLDKLMMNDILENDSILSLLKRRWKRLLRTKERNIGFRELLDTTTQTSTKTEKVEKLLYIDKYGRKKTEASLNDTWYTILIETVSIILLKILQLWRGESIKGCTSKKDSLTQNIKQKTPVSWRGLDLLHLNDTSQKSEENDIEKTDISLCDKQSSSNIPVYTVVRVIKTLGRLLNTVATSVLRTNTTKKRETSKQEPVTVENSTKLKATQEARVVHQVVPIKLDEPVYVYNIEVEGDQMYYANGYLVANCMMHMIWFVRDEIQHVNEEELGVFETDWNSVLF